MSIKFIITLVQFALITHSAAQNIGINTTVPRAKLEVAGVAGGGATSAVFGGNGAGISFQRNWPTIGFNQFRDDVSPGTQGKYLANGFAAIHTFDPGSGDMYIETFGAGLARNYTPAANGRLVFKANGNLGICNGTPTATLAVGRGNTATNTFGTATFRSIDIQSHFNFSVSENTYIRGGNATAGVIINQAPISQVSIGAVSIGGGLCRVGINTPGEIPSATVVLKQPQDVNAISVRANYNWSQRIQGVLGGASLTMRYGDFNTLKGQFSHVDGAYTAFSDNSLKTSVQPLPSVLNKINLLRPVRYEMKKDNPNHNTSIGFIAQEVKELFPLLVRQINSNDRTGEPIKDLHTMNYSGFGVLAIKALQEQYAEIQQLQNELDKLLAELNKFYN